MPPPDDSFVVVGQPPSDLDSAFVAPDPRVLGVQNASLPSICDMLRAVPLEPAIVALAAIAAAAWHARMDQAKHLNLADDVFVGRPILDRLRAFVAEDRHHVIFSEQHLAILMRLLLIYGSVSAAGADLTDAEIDALLAAMIAVGGLTERHADPEHSGRLPMGWVPWLVRSGLYFDRSNLGSDQGRARALFVDLAGEADREGHNWCDLAGWAKTDIADFEVQLAFGYALGAFSRAFDEDIAITERFIAIRREGLLTGMLDPGQVTQLVEAISADRGEYVRLFNEANDVDHLLWDRTPFEQRPFLRLGDGRMVLLSPRFLHSWMGEGTYYRLLDAARRRPDPSRPSRRATLRFTRFHGELVERYVQRVAERSHADQVRAGVVRIIGEQRYIGKEGTERKTPDLLLAYATDVVAIEVTGGRPARRTRVLSDPSLIEKELNDRVISKLSELDRALADILDRTVEIPEAPRDLIERIWPVLIVPATLIQSDPLWDYIQQQAPNLFAHHSALQPPTLFSVDDWERALAAVETGTGLPAILAARLGSVYRRLPPSHFFVRYYNTGRRPTYLDEQVGLAVQDARRALSFPTRSTQPHLH